MGSTNAYIGDFAGVNNFGDVDVIASNTAEVDNLAIAVSAALSVGGSAGVAIGTIDTETEAHIGAADVQVSGDVSVDATSQATIDIDADGGAVGAAAVGVMIGIGRVSTTTRAYVDDEAEVQSQNLNINANATNNVTSETIVASGGIIGVSVNQGKAITNGTVEAYIGENAEVITVNDINVSAISEDRADADTIGVSVGAAAVGVSLAEANVNPNITSQIKANAKLTANNISINAEQRNSSATADAISGAGGIISFAGADADAIVNGISDAYLSTGVELNALGNVSVISSADKDAFATGSALTVGVVGVGFISTNASTGGETKAYLNNIGASTIGGDLLLDANANHEADARTTAAEGGIAGGGVNSANALSAANVFTMLLGSDVINVSGNVTVNANAVGNVDADVGAVSLALIGTAGSASARSDWDANVRAAIGADTNLISGGDVLVQAQSTAAFITATAESTGAALGASVAGTSAFVDVFSLVDAFIASGAEIVAGDVNGNIQVIANTFNRTNAVADGRSIAVIAAGSGVNSTIRIVNDTAAFVADGTEANRTLLQAGNNISVSSESQNYANQNGRGAFASSNTVGLGVAVGNATSTASLTNNTSATIGDWATISAGNSFELRANTIADIRAEATVIAGGAGALPNSRSTVTINSDTNVSIGENSVINADTISIQSTDSLNAFANTFADTVIALVGNSTSNSQLNVTSNILAEIKQNAVLSAPTQVEIVAENTRANTNSTATSETTGVDGRAISTARNVETITTDIIAREGSEIDTTELIVGSDIVRGGRDSFIINPSADSDTLTQLVWTVVDTVVRWIADFFCSIFGCRSKRIVEDIYGWVQVPITGNEREFPSGSQTNVNRVLFDSTVNSSTGGEASLLIDENGTIIEKDDIDVIENGIALAMGDTITGPDIFVDDLVNESDPGSILIRAEGGTVNSNTNPTFNFNLGLDTVSIENRSNKNLIINDIETISSRALNDNLVEIRSNTNLNYQLRDSNNGTDLTIENTSSDPADILLAGDINNPNGITTIVANGGNVLATDASQLIDTRVLSIVANAGAIGMPGERITSILRFNDNLPSAGLVNTHANQRYLFRFNADRCRHQ